MSPVSDLRENLLHLPFRHLTGFDIENTFSSAKERIVQLMDNHCITEFINDNYINELFVNQDIPLCNYLNEDEFTQLKRETPNHLNIFSMNIRSLPKHGGESLVFLKLLETDFDIVVLTEIGSRNIDLVKHLLNDYDFYYVTPLNNMYGGVGIYVSSNINNVLVLDNIAVEKTCLCPKCEIESLFLNFSYMNESYVIGGIYRHPNGIVNHFVNDLENTLVKFDNKTTIIIAGDMNVDLIKFENDNTINYLTTLL